MFTVQEVARVCSRDSGQSALHVHIGQSWTVSEDPPPCGSSSHPPPPEAAERTAHLLRILSSIFSIIKSSSMDTSVQEEVEMMVESLLDVLLQALLSIMSKSQSQEAVRGQRCPQCTAEITGEYVSCLLSLLRQMTDIHFQRLVENFQSKEELKEFLLKIFIILTTAQYLSPALHKNFTEAEFDFKVWNSYFSLAVLYINQPSLQLETLIPGKRKKVLDKYGDMRVMMTYELFSMWQNLGENKIHFIPGMIGPFLGVTLVPQLEVRNIMIPIFHDMMDWEQRKNGNFKQVEAELIDKLDSLVSEGKGDETTESSSPAGEDRAGDVERDGNLLRHLCHTTDGRLLDYRDCMKGDETENKKIGCTVNLLNFYKSDINKEEMYIRYIHKLCDMHLQAENYTEAGFTLLLYWELLHWDERPLKDFLHYPAQTEWHRKEGLCRKVVHYFNKGKCWEFGIPLCRELAFQYETLYDYQSLSWIRKMEAAYYDNIMEQQRLEPEFFRVGFYGRKFPFFLRNKEFVCRGHDYERLEAFQQRMLGEFPQAIAMQHPNQPDEAILQCDAQCILKSAGSMNLQIYAVSAVPDSLGVLQMDRVPDRIKSFYRSLWIERTTLILTHPLPGISRWFENKNQELRTLISQYQHKQLHGNINLLSMTLNGVIDAAVNGGIARYQEAFFDKEYITSHPEDTEKITQLKDLMQEQKLVHPEMRPLHKKLIDQFQMMRSSLCQVRSSWFREIWIRSKHPRGIMSPESFKLMHRHSPIAVLTAVRPPSSLSSPSSSETRPAEQRHVLKHRERTANEPPEGFVPPVLTTPSSWSLDSGTRDVLPFLSAHVGVMAPPVPPATATWYDPLTLWQHLSMHFDAFHHQVSDLPPALPARSLRKSPLHPIPASPTSPQSVLDGSSSNLSGSASSGVSSLSESNFGPPPSSSCDPPIGPLDSAPLAPWTPRTWTTNPSDSVAPNPKLWEETSSRTSRIFTIIITTSPIFRRFTTSITSPPLPPKPYLREGCIPEEDTQTPMPRPMPRKISQPIIAATKEEQRRWRGKLGSARSNGWDLNVYTFNSRRKNKLRVALITKLMEHLYTRLYQLNHFHQTLMFHPV
ncbi:hypothetical protein F7725_016389 [Dissostichus mawsoni]|uniref:DOCKER domain-containing protein n=1 Tax=Dissostichus mawsoni TaxID=36200 RepID=A0A7J5Z1Y4_DISMA|nr:hypothetical protein F7725_016389 [Dissostichus mawsoni]